jgi:hypothetical protein
VSEGHIAGEVVKRKLGCKEIGTSGAFAEMDLAVTASGDPGVMARPEAFDFSQSVKDHRCGVLFTGVSTPNTHDKNVPLP